MGFFSKIKENLNHGGIKIAMTAPASVSTADSSIPVTLNITGGTEQHTIKLVRVAIIAESFNSGFNNDSNSTANQSVRNTVAQIELNQPFILGPNEAKVVQADIVMNAGQTLADSLQLGGAAAGLANAFAKVVNAAESLSSNNYTYTIEASAQIEGIAIGPGCSQPIQVLRPGQIGSAINIKL